MGGIRNLTALLAVAIGCSSMPSSPHEAVGRAEQAASAPGESIVWTRSDPLTRHAYAALAYDEARGRAVLWGGRPSLHDTLLWNGRSWTRADVPVFPFEALGTPMTYDAKRKRVVLLRGAQTWEWDGVAWLLHASTFPDPRSFGMLAYDRKRAVTVLFGGLPTRDDTWEYDGATWSKRDLATRPPGRSEQGLTYDAVRERIVMFGGLGAGNATLADTWEYDGAWTRRVTAASPSARYTTQMAYDAERQKVVLFGGEGSPGGPALSDTWELDAAGWRNIAVGSPPSARGHHGLAFDTDRKRVVLVGGAPASTTLDQDRADTWEYDGTTWTLRSGATDPTSSRDASMAYDSARARTVLFGGYSDVFGVLGHFEWDGSTWISRTFAVTPSQRVDHAMVYDAARSRIVMFGGDAPGGLTELDETWEFDGTSWLQKMPVARPSARGGHVMAYDAKRNVTVLFGGRDQLLTYHDDTWEYDGVSWLLRSPATRPDQQRDRAMAYDPVAERVVLFGAKGAFNDVGTWEWDGANWIERATATKPPRRWGSAMATDFLHGRVVMFGGSGTGGVLGDTWAYSAGNWQRLDSVGPPSARADHSMAFDSARGEVLLVGGLDGIVGGNETPGTWVAIVRGNACTIDANCPGGFCTDGVCCASRACAACETCHGTSPGVCTPVVSEADPDSCSGLTSCDRAGVCKKALGTAALASTECASGIVADGVCCDSACDGTCLACDASRKESGTRSGICDFTKAGLDPRENCPSDDRASCLRDGACDGRGGCRNYEKASACGEIQCVDNRVTGAICDGLGACGVSATGADCSPYRCSGTEGCPTTCSGDEGCIPSHLCDREKCVPKTTGVCVDDHSVRSPEGAVRDCGRYLCENGECKTKCTSVSDCVFPNSCDAAGQCVTFADAPSNDSGCVVGRDAHMPAAWTLVIAMIARARRTRRAAARRAR